MNGSGIRGAATALAFAALASCGREPPDPDAPARRVLERAAAWLWERQSPDGAWRSETYGVLRSGQAYTPFVLDALLRIPADSAASQPDRVRRALDFIRRRVSTTGALGAADPDMLEYPLYATAYAHAVLLRSGDSELAQRMERRLADWQFAEHNGFRPDSPAYGGWGFGGRHPPGVTGHMDLSHTRAALRALRAAGASEEVFERARTFLAVVQGYPPDRHPPGAWDGGFCFSPVIAGINKGGAAEGNGRYRSYATATCEGALALIAAGVARDDERVRAAAAWLERHDDIGRVEGALDPWPAALFHYHLAARAEVRRTLGIGKSWKPRIVDLLAARQAEDGSFANRDSALMKEDDPILATALAVIALAELLAPGAR